MHLTARMTTWVCTAFALVCTGFVVRGISALPALADEAERELTRGYTFFWGFLLAVALAFGILSHLMARGRFGPLDD